MTPAHPVEGEWELRAGELHGFERPCLPGTRLTLRAGALQVDSANGECYRHSFKTEDGEDPPELHCQEGGVTYSVWLYRLGDATLELVYADPGEPGRPTWAGFPPTSAAVRRAVFRRIH